MQYTENYRLPQWVMTDRIQMQDFNDMTAKIEAGLTAGSAALTAESAERTAAVSAEAAERRSADAAQQALLDTHTAQIAKLGNCEIYVTRYVGNGKFGESNKNSLTFPHKPLLVLISEGGRIMHLLNGSANGYHQSGTVGHNNTVTWSGNTVSWSCTAAGGQMNGNGSTYFVVALLVKE